MKKFKNGVLYQGDCLEIMPTLAPHSVDMILCDLPYGTTACKWDSIIPFEPLWREYKRLIKPRGAIVLTASQPFTSALVMSNAKDFRHEWVWFKNVPTGMAQASRAPMKYHESVLVFCAGKITTFNKRMEPREGKGKKCYAHAHYCGENNHVKMNKVKLFYPVGEVNPSSVILFNSVPNRRGKLHPTQKPVALFEYLIKTYTQPGAIVLDNCAGSGTTGEACNNTGRRFVLIEQEKNYCDIIKKRLAK
ncbi:MAG: site-specific DNA-methyltransferase [Micavibrio sp.]|nr:site-specific DNA-methyltransferase [Micavibrio sp.]